MESINCTDVAALQKTSLIFEPFSEISVIFFHVEVDIKHTFSSKNSVKYLSSESILYNT